MISRRWVTGGALALGLALSAFSSAQERLFTPEEMRADIAFMMQTFEDVHPNIYAYAYKADTTYKRQQLEGQLTRPMNVNDFHDLLEPFVDGFGDGHTGIVGSGKRYANQLASDEANPNSYRFSVPKSGVGLIDFRAFANLERFQSFLQDTFTQIQANKISTLIVDLRANGGGNSALGDALLQYLTNQRFRQFSRTEIKVSTQLTDWIGKGGASLPWPAGTAIGSIYKLEDGWVLPRENLLRFSGFVYILTSYNTFSSASQLAATVKDLKLGVVVGEETRGHPTTYGDFITFLLPNSDLEAFVSTKYFVRPGGFDEGRGVIPDVQIPSDQALSWVLEQVK